MLYNFLSANRDTFKNLFKIILFILLCFSTLTLFMCITAFVIYHINFTYDTLYPVTTIILCLSAFIDGFIISKIVKENGLILGVLAGAVICIIVIITSVYMGNFQITENLLTKIIATILSGALAGIIGVNLN